MKAITLFFTLILMYISGNAIAQAGKYESGMQKMMQQMGTARDAASFQAISNGFYRIGEAEKNLITPYYNAAYTLLISAFIEMESNMPASQLKADQVISYIEKMKSMSPSDKESSEIKTLEAYALIAKVSEDPMNKGAMYTAQVHQLLDEATALNPGNGRALYLKGMYLYNTPAFFGGGPSFALPFLEHAGEAFLADDHQTLMIRWGAEDTVKLLAKAQAEIGGK